MTLRNLPGFPFWGIPTRNVFLMTEQLQQLQENGFLMSGREKQRLTTAGSPECVDEDVRSGMLRKQSPCYLQSRLRTALIDSSKHRFCCEKLHDVGISSQAFGVSVWSLHPPPPQSVWPRHPPDLQDTSTTLWCKCEWVNGLKMDANSPGCVSDA